MSKFQILDMNESSIEFIATLEIESIVLCLFVQSGILIIIIIAKVVGYKPGWNLKTTLALHISYFNLLSFDYFLDFFIVSMHAQ